jgi:hypothetical protein
MSVVAGLYTDAMPLKEHQLSLLGANLHACETKAAPHILDVGWFRWMQKCE